MSAKTNKPQITIDKDEHARRIAQYLTEAGDEVTPNE